MTERGTSSPHPPARWEVLLTSNLPSSNVHLSTLHTSTLDVSDLGELDSSVQHFADSMMMQNLSCVYHLFFCLFCLIRVFCFVFALVCCISCFLFLVCCIAYILFSFSCLLFCVYLSSFSVCYCVYRVFFFLLVTRLLSAINVLSPLSNNIF